MIRPSQLAKGSEDGEQAALFCWAAAVQNHGWNAACLWADNKILDLCSHSDGGFEAIKWMHAIPNGGSRGDTSKARAIRGANLKATGVKAGVSDIFWPFPYNGMFGLYIEMKKAFGGKVSPEQKQFGKFVQNQGYGFAVCHGWRNAANTILTYIEHDYRFEV